MKEKNTFNCGECNKIRIFTVIFKSLIPMRMKILSINYINYSLMNRIIITVYDIRSINMPLALISHLHQNVLGSVTHMGVKVIMKQSNILKCHYCYVGGKEKSLFNFYYIYIV